MESRKSDHWLRRARQFAVGAGVALATTVLTVGCGGGGNGGGGGGGGGGITPLDTQEIALEVADLALDFTDYAELLLEAAEDPESAIFPFSVDASRSAGASGNPLVNVTRGIMRLTKDTGEISTQGIDEDFCDGGSVVSTETDNGYELVFNQCESELFGTKYELDGKIAYLDREDGGKLTYDQFRSSLSKGSDILTLDVNGSIDLVITDPVLPTGIVTLDLSYDVSVACGGSEASGSFSYEKLVIEVANDGGMTINGGFSFSFQDAEDSGSVSATIATVEAIRFENETTLDHPSSGKVNVTFNGQTVAIEYVQGGVLIDGEFVSWEEIEADFDDDDFDDVSDQCEFFDSDSDFDSDFDFND